MNIEKRLSEARHHMRQVKESRTPKQRRTSLVRVLVEFAGASALNLNNFELRAIVMRISDALSSSSCKAVDMEILFEFDVCPTMGWEY